MASKALALVSELDRYMAEINRYPILSAEEELQLARRWRHEGDVAAAHALVTANLRFVVKIALEYRGYGTRLLDLVQEGSVGLMQAVKRFDPERGYRLLTFAVFWIRAYIHEHLMGTLRIIKIGTSRAHRKLFYKLRSLKGRLAARGIESRDEVLTHISHETGVSLGEVEEMDRHLSGADASLDQPAGDSGVSLSELMPSGRPTQEDELGDLEAEADRHAHLEQALGELKPREREVIEARYLTETPRQLHELGAAWGVTKQRVAQIERQALTKLRARLAPALDPAA